MIDAGNGPMTSDPVITDKAVSDALCAVVHGADEPPFLGHKSPMHAYLAAAAPEILRANQPRPRAVSTAAELRGLGEAVRDGTGDMPMVLLVEDNGVVWRMSPVMSGNPGEPPEVWMVDERRATCTWHVDRVTDDGITGHGPWTIVWSRGVEL